MEDFPNFTLAMIKLHPVIRDLLRDNPHLSVESINLEEQEIIIFNEREGRSDYIEKYLGYSGLVLVVD